MLKLESITCGLKIIISRLQTLINSITELSRKYQNRCYKVITTNITIEYSYPWTKHISQIILPIQHFNPHKLYLTSVSLDCLKWNVKVAGQMRILQGPPGKFSFWSWQKKQKWWPLLPTATRMSKELHDGRRVYTHARPRCNQLRNRAWRQFQGLECIQRGLKCSVTRYPRRLSERLGRENSSFTHTFRSRQDLQVM